MHQTDYCDVAVIGGGAAGMMAAITATKTYNNIYLIEKNEKLGKKLFITGKGRCNFTNSCDTEDIFTQVVTNAKFLYSSIYGFTNHDVIHFFEDNGLKVKEERGGRMFPASDKSSDVIKALENALKKTGVKIFLNTTVTDIITENIDKNSDKYSKKITGIVCDDSHHIQCDKIILATGGMSYPATGSTGDGYRFAERLGHSVTDLRSGLTGINTVENYPSELAGLTLTNTAITITDKSSKKLYEGFGELLLTHFGVSGPIVLSASSILGDRLESEHLTLHMDIKPALGEKKLDERLLREVDTSGKKSIKHILEHMMPRSLVPIILDMCDIDPDTRGYDIRKSERHAVITTMKDIKVTLESVRGFEEAIITRGGISVKDINPSTLESRIVSGLYLAGEILDVDALTGGYNLQIAWSTGALSGQLR